VAVDVSVEVWMKTEPDERGRLLEFIAPHIRELVRESYGAETREEEDAALEMLAAACLRALDEPVA
jgi:hypothetical protein